MFDSVELKYETVSTNLWDVHYDLTQGKTIEVSPLFGFGSYDLVRVGVEVQQNDLWGLAHSSDVKVIQSVRSSSGEYTYTIPQVFAQDVDVFATANALRREEISYVDQEYGGGLGVRRNFRDVATDVSLRYNYGILQATEESANFIQEGAQNPTVGEFILDVRHDRRDNPLDPRRGYDVLANVEIASQYLGGSASYDRVELGSSYHIPLNDSEWIHLGLRHGFVVANGSASNNLPFIRRFFPGGEDTVRGYEEGEAAPRNAQGQIVGAETYTLGNVDPTTRPSRTSAKSRGSSPPFRTVIRGRASGCCRWFMKSCAGWPLNGWCWRNPGRRCRRRPSFTKLICGWSAEARICRSGTGVDTFLPRRPRPCGGS